MGHLRAAPDGRVITMSSGGMYSQRLDVTALEPHAADYDGVKAYARAKRAQVELTRLWDLHHGGLASGSSPCTRAGWRLAASTRDFRASRVS